MYLAILFYESLAVGKGDDGAKWSGFITGPSRASQQPCRYSLGYLLAVAVIVVVIVLLIPVAGVATRCEAWLRLAELV
jgi:hypothetical protein